MISFGQLKSTLFSRISENQIDDRPYVDSETMLRTGWVMQRHIHDWCRENDIKYEIGKTTSGEIKIMFKDENSAIMFKMNWL